MRRPGTPGPQGGGVYLPLVQRTRLLDAALAVVADEGVKRLSATRVSGRAGMSTKTFYDLFEDSEDCFLAVFSRTVDELAAGAAPAWAGEGEWVERVRAALTVLLATLEREPVLGKVVFVEALGAGPRVLARRAEVLDRVAELLDQGRVDAPAAAGLPSLVAAGVAGAAFSVIHARLLEQRPASLMELVGPVMATVVLPYRGREASARELARPVPALPVFPESPEDALGGDRSLAARPGDDSTDSQARGASGAGSGRSHGRPAEAGPIGRENVRPRLAEGQIAPPIAPVRPTRRTYMVLAAVSELGGANNRQVGVGAQLRDDSQISRLLSRLEGFGLVENRGGQSAGLPKSWWLTASGEEFLRAGLSDASVAAGARPVRRGRPPRAGRPVPRRALQGGVQLSRGGMAERRRVRMLRAAVAMVDEHGYAGVTVAHIAGRAKVSRRTFYELFVDREACLLAVLEDIDTQLAAELQAADLDGQPWRERVRMGLWTVLRFFDREPGLARFCVVQSARGDERMASYREELLARIVGVIAEGGRESVVAGEFSPLVGEGLAGAAVSILNTRLSATGRRAASTPRKDAPASAPLGDLLGELMGLIVLPYFGPEVAREERARPAPADPAPARLPVPAPGSKKGGRYLALDPVPSRGPRLRMTYRTALVLEAIAQAPGISNLDVARHAQVNDQGQISKLLSRLERNGLVQNTGRGQTQGAPNEWRLTSAGQKVEQNIREHQKQAA